MTQIAILTWHYHNNYGSALQAYALQETIKGINSNVEILNYQNKLYSSKFIIRQIQKVDVIYKMLCFLCGKMRTYQFYRFRKKYFTQSKLYQNSAELKKSLEVYQTIVVGSDQIWAPNVFDPIYMLEFVDCKKTRKVSYAASIGLETIPASLLEIYQKLLSEFSFISVREEQGKKLLHEKCRLESCVVLDPTLLVDAKIYRQIMRPVQSIKSDYIFCYFLNGNHQYRKKVEEYAKRNNLNIYGFSANISDCKWMKILSNLSPQEFIWMIENASAVFTDSYHGTIFSLLLHKTFFVFQRFDSDDPICQNSRIRQLCATFNIDSRILIGEKECDECNIYNWVLFEQQLSQQKQISLSYLREALEEDATVCRN